MRPIVPLFLCLLLAAQPAHDSAVNQARSVTRTLALEVRQLLSDALAANGYAGAIQACAQTAQAKTQAVSANLGVPVRRVSLRYRNPLNKPDKWEGAKLTLLAKQSGSVPDEVYAVVRNKGRQELRYLKPIKLEALCLGCHGDTKALAPGVAEKLKTLYPTDKATGYHAGQLRGAISIRVPLS